MVALIQASLAFSLAFVLVAALSPWLSRTVGVRWWYWVWLLLALRLLIPYSAAWPQAPLVLEASEAQTQVELTPVEAQTPAAAQSPAEAPTAGWKRWAIPVYWSGAGLFAGYYAINGLFFHRRLRRWSHPARRKQTLTILGQAQACLRIRRPVRLMVCPLLPGPALQGLFRPTVLLPTEEMEPDDLALVFAHELSHLKCHDLWYKRLLLCVQGLHWFNPLVHVMARLARNDLELACDSRVVERQDARFRARYGYSLLKAAEAGRGRDPVAALRMGGGKQALQRRLGHLFDGQPRREGLALVACVSAVLIFSGALLGQASALSAPHYASADDYSPAYFDPANPNFYLLSPSILPDEAPESTTVVVYSTTAIHSQTYAAAVRRSGDLENSSRLSTTTVPAPLPSAFASAAGLPLSGREGEAYAVPALGLKAHAAVALLPAGGNAPDGWMLQAGDTVSLSLNMSADVPVELGYCLDGERLSLFFSGSVASGVCRFTVPEDGAYSFLIANPSDQEIALHSGAVQLDAEGLYHTTTTIITTAAESFSGTTVIDSRPME